MGTRGTEGGEDNSIPLIERLEGSRVGLGVRGEEGLLRVITYFYYAPRVLLITGDLPLQVSFIRDRVMRRFLCFFTRLR